MRGCKGFWAPLRPALQRMARRLTLHVCHLEQTASVRDRCWAPIPERIIVEVAEAEDAQYAPVSDTLSPRRKLVILKRRPPLAAVESEIGPVSRELHIERNSPTDGQAQCRVCHPQQ